MASLNTLQRELGDKIKSLNYQYLGIEGRFKYPGIDIIDRLSQKDISNISRVVAEILNLGELEKTLNSESGQEIRLRYKQGKEKEPFRVSRESILKYGETPNEELLVHISQHSPDIGIVEHTTDFDGKFNIFSPFLLFQARKSVNPNLDNLYFSICATNSINRFKSNYIPKLITSYDTVTQIPSDDEPVFRRRGIKTARLPI